MATIPTSPPANPIPGAVYIDTATNFAYVWTGNSWIRTSGTSTSYNTQITTGATILPGHFSAPSPEEFIPQVGANEPINPYAGQLWTDTGLTPSPTYVWDGTQWIVISDGKTTDTSVDTVPPANPDTGDTFYELTTQRFYVYDGTSWVALTGGTASAADTHSFTGAAAPTLSLRPNGTSLVVGDQFVNTSIPELYFWTGASWQAVSTPSSVDYANWGTVAWGGTTLSPSSTESGTIFSTDASLTDINLPNYGSTPFGYRIKVWSSVNNTVNINPSGTDKIRSYNSSLSVALEAWQPIEIWRQNWDAEWMIDGPGT